MHLFLKRFWSPKQHVLNALRTYRDHYAVCLFKNPPCNWVRTRVNWKNMLTLPCLSRGTHIKGVCFSGPCASGKPFLCKNSHTNFALTIKNWMGPNPNGPRSVSCDRDIRYLGFFGVRSVGPVGDFLDLESDNNTGPEKRKTCGKTVSQGGPRPGSSFNRGEQKLHWVEITYLQNRVE